jgi:GGDEF domain-containing protein
MAESVPAPRSSGVVDYARFSAAAERALAHGEGRGVVLIEVDGADDAVMLAAEARIVRTIRPSDLLGRLTRYRFAVLARTDGGPEQVGRVATRVATRLGEPFNVGGRHVKLVARIGVAVAEGDADTAAKILLRAEQAFDAPR